jgi:RHS repeat-associated protein
MGYTAFGQLAYTSGSSGTNYLFGATSGYRNDGDWVYLLGARYYDPQVGVFLTRDTYLYQKPYLYCDHDPINHLDPSGHKDEKKVDGMEVGHAAFVGFIGGIVAGFATADPAAPFIGGLMGGIGAGLGEYLWQSINNMPNIGGGSLSPAVPGYPCPPEPGTSLPGTVHKRPGGIVLID